MKSIDPKRDKKAFDTACANAKLEPEEADWLWNYLDKGCDKAIYGKTKVRDNPPFASSGW